MNEKRVLFVIPSLNGGGAERVLIDILNNLSPLEYRINLVVFNFAGALTAEIPSYVKVYSLEKKHFFSFFKLCFGLAKLIYSLKPTVILSFLSYANIVCIISKLICLSSAKLVITLHGHISISLKLEKRGVLKKFFYRVLYRFADYCIVTSKGVREDILNLIGIDPGKVVVIYNPVNIGRIMKLSRERLPLSEKDKFILAVGRLTRQKNYPLLLKSYSLIHREIAERLIILGEGGEIDSLKELSVELGIEKRVAFVGFQRNPYAYMNRASLFVLSSLMESFALVIVEAMACGVPVISTDCPSGPGEIITNRVNGLLVSVDNEKMLAEQMLSLLTCPSSREMYIENGRARALEFDVGVVVPQYKKFLNEGEKG